MHALISRRLMVAPAAAGIALLTATAAVAAPTVLVDHTVTQTLGGAEICTAGPTNCIEVYGVKNVHLKATFEGATTSLPSIERVSAPGCSANINVAFKLTTPGVGPGGKVKALVEYDKTDKNGNIIGHRTLGPVTVLIPVSATPITINPLVSLCGTALA